MEGTAGRRGGQMMRKEGGEWAGAEKSESQIRREKIGEDL